jgi:hypothetical protein
MRLTPQRLRSERKEIPLAQNGYPHLLRAGRRQGKTPKLPTPIPTPPERFSVTKAEQALKPLAPALAELERAMAKPVWQPPVRKGMGAVYPEFLGLRNLVRALALRARVRLEKGDAAGAVDDLLTAQRFATRLRKSEPVFIGWLVASACESTANRAARYLAWHPKMTRAALTRLDREWPRSEDAGATYAEALRVEWRETIGCDLARTVSGPGAPSPIRPGHPLYDVEHTVEEILRGHPHPFDRVGTVRTSAEILVTAIQAAERPWEPNRASFVPPDLVEGWPVKPDQLDAITQLSAEQRKAAARRLRDVENPYGRFMAGMLLPILDEGYRVPFRLVAESRATRIVCDARLYAMAHNGALPMAIAPSPDPFGTGNLRYDRTRRVFWSVGPNGKDDGGRDRPDSRDGKDFVWRIDGVVVFPTRKS